MAEGGVASSPIRHAATSGIGHVPAPYRLTRLRSLPRVTEEVRAMITQGSMVYM